MYRKEIYLDVTWILLCLFYIYQSAGIPADGRLAPLAIAWLGLLVGVFQISGYFVKSVTAFTIGQDSPPQDEDSEILGELTRESGSHPDFFQKRHVIDSPFFGMFWLVSLVLLILFLGAIYSIPIFIFVYFWIRGRKPILGLLLGILMTIIVYLVMQTLLDINLPIGLLVRILS